MQNCRVWYIRIYSDICGPEATLQHTQFPFPVPPPPPPPPPPPLSCVIPLPQWNLPNPIQLASNPCLAVPKWLWWKGDFPALKLWVIWEVRSLTVLLFSVDLKWQSCILWLYLFESLRSSFPCNMEENCVFYNKSLATGKTIQLTLKGCKSIKEASKLRQEDIEVVEKQFVHENCRTIYCDKIKIERDLKNRRHAESTSGSRQTTRQSSGETFQYKTVYSVDSSLINMVVG